MKAQSTTYRPYGIILTVQNLEIAFAYHAAPGGRGVSSRSHNMHVEVDFYLGIKGVFGIPLRMTELK